MTDSSSKPLAGFRSLRDPDDRIVCEPVELQAEDGAASRGVLYWNRGARPRVGVHLMHPRTDQSTNYNILPLARAGYAVLGRAGRWANNDVATTHEHLLLDVAAGIRLLLDSGCEQVVLLGNSGGSSLAAFYQAQAGMRVGGRLTETPAGDPFDLNSFRMPPANGIVMVAGHVGQAGVLSKLIDPSVVDESDPFATDPSLDLYDRRNGFQQPPGSSRYDQDFLEKYRAGQAARVRRIDMRALTHIQRQREARLAVEKLGPGASLTEQRAMQFDPYMLIHRTVACPEFVDLSIEPDDRRVRSYFSGEPHVENFGSGGFARYTTPRAWLSTWSANYSNARTAGNLVQHKGPLLIVHYSGDCGTRLSEVQSMYDASGSSVKELAIVPEVDHYGFQITPDGHQGPRSAAGVSKVVDWMRTHFP